MTSSGEDDYGDLNDEDMMMVAKQAEERELSTPEHRPSKRRRLSSPTETNSQGDQSNQLRCNKKTKESLRSGRVSPIDEEEDGDYHSRPVSVSRETDTPQKKPKSKYRIHIPKRAEVPKDAFFTQPPPSSSSPYRIRGPQWQEVRRPAETSRPSIPVCSDEEDAFDPSPHLVRARAQALDQLADLPSDAFASSSPPSKDTAKDDAIHGSPSQQLSQRCLFQRTEHSRATGTQTNLRQTTLFGAAAGERGSDQQAPMRRNWPLATKEEAPTHHKLDLKALETWTYPTNLGTIRDYQYNIVQRGLYHNLLVALPTGLGKTFIAATIMLNWFRWTVDSQIFFVAPTRPLVSQQVEACFNIAGIPRSATSMLTGGTSSQLRSQEYLTKRVFFMTPQTLMNDLRNGNCDPKKMVLLVVDEAHRATGKYAYGKIVQLVRQFNPSFRILALTATPGASVEAVQAVIDGLDISRVEIRTEISIDLRQYVHSRKVDTEVFDNSEEMEMLMDLWAKSLKPMLIKLNGLNACWVKDPIELTPFGLTTAWREWLSSRAGQKAGMGVKGMVGAIFKILSSLAHATVLLRYHGISPFYHNLRAFRDAMEKGGKYRRQIIESDDFGKLMNTVQHWIADPEFVGHPKLDYLRTVVLNHFMDANRGGDVTNPPLSSGTRIMVFVQFRDSAEQVVRVLKRHEPMIKPHVFVGQANAKGSDGMDQKKQSEIISKFKEGVYNTIVATSIGEEGLDIGEVDLIVCYDSSASPIRMLQRMGRTGRKRAGNIVVLLMRGKEENSFAKAKDNYEKIQQMIAKGTRFEFHEDRSKRIVPKDLQPVVDKKVIEIPLENTQPGLPEPKKRGKLPKKPPKKFHMPEGVRTGFFKASCFNEREKGSNSDIDEDEELQSNPPQVREPTPELEPIPALAEVLLTTSEENRLRRDYLDVGGETAQIVEAPRVDAFPVLQRVLRPIKHLRHGRVTQRMVAMLKTVNGMDDERVARFERNLYTDDKKAQSETPRRNTKQGVPASNTKATVFRSRRSEASLSLETNLHSSEDEEDDDHSLSGFIVDDLEGDDQEDVSPITSSPPSSDGTKLPFYTPTGKTYGAGSDSEEELPEFSRLVETTGFINAASLG